MNNIIDKYEENIILNNNTQELYERNNSTTIIKCSQLVAYNYTSLITKWAIVGINGNKIYQSGRYLQWDTWSLSLSILEVAIGYQLKLKGVVLLSKDSYSDVILEYDPNGATVYFRLIKDAPGTAIQYLGLVPSSETPPVLQCSKVNGYNSANLTTHWEIINAIGKVIYESGRCGVGKSTTISLSNLELQPGEEVRFKALDIGSDSTAYIVLKYIPTSDITAYFELEGMSAKTVTMYRGTTLPNYDN